MKAGRGIRSLGWAALLAGAVVGGLRAEEDGAFRLRYAAGNSGSVRIISSPALDDEGYLYVGVTGRNSNIGRVMAIDPVRGQPKPGWPVAGFSGVTGGVLSSPTVGPARTLYFGGMDGFVYAIDRDTAQLKWKKQCGVSVTSSGTLNADGTILYIGSGGFPDDDTSGENGLHALRTSDGDRIWVFKTKREVESSPALAADGTVFFGCHDGNIYAVNTASRSLKWLRPTGDRVSSSPALGADGTVYVGSHDAGLYALFPETGEIKWRHSVDNRVHASPVLGSDGTIYFGTLGKSFYALDPRDGSERWSPLSTAGPIFSSAAVRSDGVVFFGCDDGRLRGIESETGKSHWSKEVVADSRVSPPDIVDSSPVIARDGSVYVGSNDGNIYGYYGVGVTSIYSRWPMFQHDIGHTGRATVLPEGGRLINLSTRAQAGQGKTLIAGLATSGGGEKNYLIRAAGPAIADEPFRVPNPLADPAFSVMSPGANSALFSNNDWNLESNSAQIRQAFSQVGAFPFAEGSKDAAVLRPLRGGLYTAVVSGAPGSSGIALVEAYDADVANSSTRLINLSTLAQAGSGNDVLIAGLVIGGSAPVRVLVRGIGPSLASFGVVAPLAKPSLAVFAASVDPSAIASSFLNNEGWSASVQKGDTAGMSRVVGAFPLPEGSADCAALVSLSPGAYTIRISGVDNTTGTALVEVYLLP